MSRTALPLWVMLCVGLQMGQSGAGRSTRGDGVPRRSLQGLHFWPFHSDLGMAVPVAVPLNFMRLHVSGVLNVVNALFPKASENAAFPLPFGGSSRRHPPQPLHLGRNLPASLGYFGLKLYEAALGWKTQGARCAPGCPEVIHQPHMGLMSRCGCSRQLVGML